jgi:predicted PurR-regulated permease PerM
MMIDSSMFLIIVFACGSIVQIVSSIICYRNIISYSKDQAMAVKMLLELLNKEFQSNQTQHTELLESLTANDQKIADSLADSKKNIFNLAVFLGYRPRNLEEV